MSKKKKINKMLTAYVNMSPLLRQAVLLDVIAELSLPASERVEVLTDERINELRQLVHYAGLVDQVENQKPFTISEQYSEVVLAPPLNEYLGLQKPNQMILKKPLDQIPLGVWELLHQAQRTHLERTVHEDFREQRLALFDKEKVKIRSHNPEELKKRFFGYFPKSRHFELLSAQLGVNYTGENTDLEKALYAGKRDEVIPQIVAQAGQIMYDPKKLWEEAYQTLTKATRGLSPKKQAKVLASVEVLKRELEKIPPGQTQKKELLYKDFKKHCSKIMEGKHPKILKTVLTITSVLFSATFGAVMGFGMGLMMGSWSGPGAFLSAVAGGSIMAVGAFVGAGLQAAQTGGFVGYKLFNKRACEKSGIKEFLGGLKIIDELEKKKDQQLGNADPISKTGNIQEDDAYVNPFKK
jgi:hypothetical protein